MIINFPRIKKKKKTDIETKLTGELQLKKERSGVTETKPTDQRASRNNKQTKNK